MLAALLAAALAHPGPGIAVTPAGGVAFVQGPTHTVWIVTPGELPRRLAVGEDAGDLSVPHTLQLHRGRLVTASDRNDAIVSIGLGGEVSRLYPSPAWPGADWPRDIRVGAGGNPLLVLPGGAILAVTELDGRDTLVRIEPDGTLTEPFLGEPFENLPLSCFALAPDGSVYFTEDGKRIRRISPEGELSTVVDHSILGARGIAIHPDGSLVVADAENRKILRVRDGKVGTIAGSGQRGGEDAREAGAASFFEPTGVAVAPDGTIYVLDYPRDVTPTIREISPDGRIRTIARTEFP